MATKVRKTDRRVFMRDLRKAIARGTKTDSTIALLVVQVEQLDKVEGAFGYDASRKLLEEFGDRLESLLSNNDRLLLVGDRKYCLVLNDLVNEGHAVLAANKVQRLTLESFSVGEDTVDLEASVGIAMFPDHATNENDLARRGEVALASAVEKGIPFSMYSEGGTVQLASLWHRERELAASIDENQIELYYQPKIDLLTGRPCGAEALMRWNHPTSGLVLPDVFIPLAERTGTLEILTWHAIDVALRQKSEWPSLWGELTVSINLSAKILKSELLMTTVQDSAGIWGSDLQYLILEVTEDAFMDDPEESFAVLELLRSEGAKVSIDDFGTGYSSMSYFKDMPADELKIDKSFVLNMLADKRDRKIVHTVIDLAHTFDFSVVAEGVETAEVRDELVAMKCDVAQGYFFGKPMRQLDFIAWLNDFQDAKPAVIRADHR